MNPPDSSIYSSRSYKIALTVAVLLFLVTLTAAIVIIIITSAREHDREAEFEITLTAAAEKLHEAQTAVADTPTPAPELTYGNYPFALSGSPAYTAGGDCTHHILTGQVLDSEDNPIDGFEVRVWGDYLAPQTVLTGEIVQQERGRWTLVPEDTVNRRVWVQIAAADRYLSAPVELVLGADDCDHNQVEVVFKQVAALE